LINDINKLSLRNAEMIIENHQQGQIDAPSCAKLSNRRFRIGFVVDGRFPSLSGVVNQECGLLSLFHGCSSDSPIGFMRFGWIANEVNRLNYDLHYELFRPFHRYDAVIFLKSMGKACFALARHLKSKGVKIIFDANVDYLSPAQGTFYYEGMAPTEAQQRDMLDMLNIADVVIGDSEYLASQCKAVHTRVCWIPDNVNMDMVPYHQQRNAHSKRTLLWSGISFKIFELLLIAPILKAYTKYFHLVIVVDDWATIDRCYEPYRSHLRDLLSEMDYEIIRFKSIEQLFSIYSEGDVFISPRFLDNTYNLGHTEWKITLAMACEKFVLASPQPSYLKVYERSDGKGLRICWDMNDWSREIEAALQNHIDLEKEGKWGRRIVEAHYSTRVIAQQHATLMKQMLHT
jgi:glycosyltransferase involved in cell wall biosynthesis